MMHIVFGYLTIFGSLVILDAIWILGFARSFYKGQIGHLMAVSPQWTPVVIFYLLYAAGLLYLVVLPAFEQRWGIGRVMLQGAIVGLVAYGAYDLTNHATLKDWRLGMTVVDISWGVLMTAGVSGFALYIMKMVTS